MQVTESVCSPQPLASHNRPLMLANVSVYVCDGVLHTEELASARVCVKEREFVCVYNNHQNKKRPKEASVYMLYEETLSC